MLHFVWRRYFGKMNNPMFSKPKSDKPTKHLFVGNCSPSLGFTIEKITSIFSAFGIPKVFVPRPDKSHLFVSYDTIEEAMNAKSQLTDTEVEGRKFIINYADIPVSQKSQDLVKTAPPIFSTAEECMVPGLQLIEEFVTSEEECDLLKLVEDENLGEWEFHNGRNVKHFGVIFNYATRNVDREIPVNPIPPLLLPTVERMQSIKDVPKLDQLTINVYPLGTGLAPHIDTHSAFTGAILSLSTGAPVVMEFRKEGVRKRLQLPQRSLLIMDKEARYCWEHYIPQKRNADITASRVSFTFRQARGFPCNCGYPTYCDSQDLKLPPTRLAQRKENMVFEDKVDNDEEIAKLQKIEDDYVHNVYDVIARHFSSTRFAIWPKVKDFLLKLEPYSVIADLGCGNGKYFNIRNDIAVIGIDRSQDLLEIAFKKHYPTGLPRSGKSLVDVGISDCLSLSLRDGSMDAVLCIAVLHHISSKERRIKVVSEALRVLREGGKGFISVWATKQEDPARTIDKWQPIENTNADYFVPWHLPLHQAEGQVALSSQDLKCGALDEKKSAIVYKRYYHLFEAGELENLMLSLEDCKIVSSFFDKSNWCVEFEKNKIF